MKCRRCGWAGPADRLKGCAAPFLGRLPGMLAAWPVYSGGGGQVNGWYLSGTVVWRGQKRGERGPWPCMIEADGGTRDNPTVRVPLDIFGDIEVGQHVELTGFLESREWQGRNFLQLTVKSRKVEWLNPAAPRATSRAAASGSAAVVAGAGRSIPADSFTPAAAGPHAGGDRERLRFRRRYSFLINYKDKTS